MGVTSSATPRSQPLPWALVERSACPGRSPDHLPLPASPPLTSVPQDRPPPRPLGSATGGSAATRVSRISGVEHPASFLRLPQNHLHTHDSLTAFLILPELPRA